MHVLVTGGSRGIGAAVCRLAGRRGWAVTLTYRSDAPAAEAVAADLHAAGTRALALRSDAADEHALAAAFDDAEAAHGPVTGVVANAGVLAPIATLADMEPDRIRRIFEVNAVGAVLTAREAARRMSRSRGGQGGSLVLVSSVAARLGNPNEFVDYAASKGAVDTLAIGLSKELGPEGVRVNAVRPGLIATGMHADGGFPDRAEALGRTMPLGRAGTAEEVAESIVWLLSDAAAYVTGALLDVAGGR